MKAKRKQIMVDAPDGYYWMEERGRYYLMPGEAHKGAMTKAPFKVKMVAK